MKPRQVESVCRGKMDLFVQSMCLSFTVGLSPGLSPATKQTMLSGPASQFTEAN